MLFIPTRLSNLALVLGFDCIVFFCGRNILTGTGTNPFTPKTLGRVGGISFSTDLPSRIFYFPTVYDSFREWPFSFPLVILPFLFISRLFPTANLGRWEGILSRFSMVYLVVFFLFDFT